MTTNHISLFAGLLVGFSIAVPIGPMGLLCIQRTLACGMRIGISTGLGAATVNVLYGAIILLGLDRLGPLVGSSGRVLSLGGGVFLLWSAGRTFLRRGVLTGAPAARLSPGAAYGSALAFNAANPMSPALILALLSPRIAAAPPSLADAAALLLGMFTAATTWWICLSFGVALLRAQLGPRVLLRVNQAAGLALTLYGLLALARAAAM